MDFPIEGDFIVLDPYGNSRETGGSEKGPYIFEIKGFSQPPDLKEIIAFIRYENVGKDYRKIYDVSEKYDWIRRNFPEWLKEGPHFYFSVPLIPSEIITAHLKPEDFLADLYDKFGMEAGPASGPLRDAYDFCLILSENSGVPLKYFGITGSLLTGTYNELSDIDIIVRGFGNCLKVREYIHGCFSGKNCGEGGANGNADSFPRRYTRAELRKLYKFRVKNDEISFLQFLRYELRKYHQGIFRGRDFFIRYLEFESRQEYSESNPYDKVKMVSLGRISVSAQVRDDKYWWTTPARLGLDNVEILDDSGVIDGARGILSEYGLELRDIYRTYTLRGRYIENARLLEWIKIKGALELVIPKNPSRAYLQISLGADPGDYMIQL